MSLRRTAVEAIADPEGAFDRLLRHNGPLRHVARDPRDSVPTAARGGVPRDSRVVATMAAPTEVPTAVLGGFLQVFRRAETPRADLSHPLPTTRDEYGTLEVFPPVVTKREFDADDATHTVFDVKFVDGIEDTDEKKQELIKANEDRVKEYFNECVKKRFGKKVKSVDEFKKKIGIPETWLTVQQNRYEDPLLVPDSMKSVVPLVPGEVKQEPELVLDVKVEPVVLQFRYQTAWLSNMFPTLLTYEVTELYHGESIPTMHRDFAIEMRRLRSLYQDAKVGVLYGKLLPPKPAAYHNRVYGMINGLRYRMSTTFLLEHRGIDNRDGSGEVPIPKQEKLLTFLSAEHAFMAQKVDYKALLTAAMDASRAYNSDPTNPGLDLDGFKKVHEAVNRATAALEVFTRIRTAPTAKEAKAIPARRGGKYKEEFLKDEMDRTGAPVPNPHYVPAYTLVNNVTVWGAINRAVMAHAIVKKFYQNQTLAELLLHLHGHHLIEGNFFGDTCWGCAMYRMPWVSLTPEEAAEGFPDRAESERAMITTVIKNTNGDAVVVKGTNWLGKALMELSDILFNESDKAGATETETRPKKMHLSASGYRHYVERIAAAMIPSPFLSKDDQDKSPFYRE
tara:strand:+ start:1884 stop:3743 length:1860 start_codon:yes stop_codon:yes gene_type:complete